MKVREYHRETLGLVVRGSLYDTDPVAKQEALWLIASKAPEKCVIIGSTIKTQVYFEIEDPHPDCKACHGEQQPVWYTAIRVEAFPMVFPEDVERVARLGKELRHVRIPVLEDITIAAVRGVEGNW